MIKIYLCTAALCLLTSCGSNSKPGKLEKDNGRGLSAINNNLKEATRATQKGKELIAEGEKLKAKGQRKIDEGQNLIEEAKSLHTESRQNYKSAAKNDILESYGLPPR